MTEFVYLIKLLSQALGFLLLGLLVSLLITLPDGRSLVGLPDNAVMLAIDAEVDFANRSPGHAHTTDWWLAQAQPRDRYQEERVENGNVVGAINASLEKMSHKTMAMARPWLVLVGMRSVALLGIVIAGLPFMFAVWLLGRRRSWVLFGRGEPATDSQRMTWSWLAGFSVFLTGIILALPFACTVLPYLVPMALTTFFMLYPIRAATAARL